MKKPILFTLISLFMCVINAETKTICRQKVFGQMETQFCPESNEYPSSELKYCCNNNGMLSCCDYNDYQMRHNGPSVTTICAIIVVELTVIMLLIWWCCKYSHSFADN